MNNLNFGLAKRKTFTIDGDESRVISIDTTDTGILGRWHEIQEFVEHSDEKIRAINEQIKEMSAEDSVMLLSKTFADADREMREKINYLFDSDVCTPIVGNGALYRFIDGEPLFTRIISQLSALYEQDIAANVQKSEAKIAKHTAKYKK